VGQVRRKIWRLDSLFFQISRSPPSSPTSNRPKKEMACLNLCVFGLGATPSLLRLHTESTMHRFDLTPELETGNADIDAHHQTLFAMANEILFSDELAQSHDLFRRAVTFLVSYVEYHFASEELAMFQSSYNRRRFHAAFHDHVRREAQDIADRMKHDAHFEETRQAIFFMLEDWVVYHVVDADRQLATHLGEDSPAGTLARLPDIRPLKAAGALAADFDERVLVGVGGLA
jgi:hemerythrin